MDPKLWAEIMLGYSLRKVIKPPHNFLQGYTVSLREIS